MFSRSSHTAHAAAIAFCSLLILLSGCSTQSQHTQPPEKTETPLPPPDETSRQQSPAIDSPSPLTTDKPPAPAGPCVYKSTKGIAEITTISETVITFKFYPGDQYFTLPVDKMPSGEIELGQELKAIIRSPLSGPCKETEFELMSAVY